jgi:hypothetical protein
VRRAFLIAGIYGAIVCSLASSAVADASGAAQSYESCSRITSEYVTVLQLASRGFSGEVLKSTLPGLSEEAEKRIDSLLQMVDKEGLAETYSTINSEYARCASGVFNAKGLPERQSREAHFHFCAGENKVRYEVLLAALIGAPEEKVLHQLQRQHRQAGETIYELYTVQGELAVFDRMGAELKYCLKGY